MKWAGIFKILLRITWGSGGVGGGVVLQDGFKQRKYGIRESNSL